MLLRNTPERYGLVTKVIHWSTAGLIFGLIALGWYMVDLGFFHRWYHRALTWHKAWGMIALGLGLAFVVWRTCVRSPRYASGMGPLQRQAATVVHILLYAAVVVVPFSGYLISTSDGKGVEVFGWFEVPALFTIARGPLRDLVIAIHYWCAYGVGVLALLHAAAALKHQFIDRDGTLVRMLWR